MSSTNLKLCTSLGDIVIALNTAAPMTSTYFADMVDKGIFADGCFYRSTNSFANSDQKSQVIQGGAMFDIIAGNSSASMKDLGLKPLKEIESTDQTGCTHRHGKVSLSRDFAVSGYALPDFYLL